MLQIITSLPLSETLLCFTESCWSCQKLSKVVTSCHKLTTFTLRRWEPTTLSNYEAIFVSKLFGAFANPNSETKLFKKRMSRPLYIHYTVYFSQSKLAKLSFGEVINSFTKILSFVTDNLLFSRKSYKCWRAHMKHVSIDYIMSVLVSYTAFYLKILSRLNLAIVVKRMTTLRWIYNLKKDGY